MAITNPHYCPICGEELTLRSEGGRERPACANCGYVHFVNPVPGVGLLIEMDGGLVLIQRKNPPHKGLWSLPSGFVEADESAEEAAVREAEEETGLKTEIIELANINSFPEGPPVSGIMIFYRLRPVGGTLRAGDDASAAQVFHRDEMPVLPFRTHREMVAQWMEQYAEQAGHKSSQEQPAFGIRPFSSEDTDDVMSLLLTIPANRNLTREERGKIALRMREMPTLEIFVAETTSSTPTVIAFAALSVVRDLTGGVGLLSSMAVLPTFKRRGVGAALLKAIMQRARELELHALWVDKSRANEQAQAFFAALGFAELELLRLRLT